MERLWLVRSGRLLSVFLFVSLFSIIKLNAQVLLARYAATNTITPASVAGNVIASSLTLGNFVSPGTPCGSGLTNRVITVGTAGTIAFTLSPAPGYKLDLAYNKAAVRSTSTGNINAPTFSYTISSGGGSGSGTGTSPTTSSCLSSAGTNTQGDWNYTDFTVNPGYSVVYSYGFTGATSTSGNTQVHTLDIYGTVTCAATISNNLIGSSQTITVNTTPSMLTGNLPTVSGTGNYAYQWQSSSDNSSFTNISGATNQNYQPGVISSNQYFRRIASYNECAIHTSASVSISTTTDPCYLAIDNNLIGSNQTISQGSSPSAFTGSIPIGATQVYTYSWEISNDNVSWNILSGGTQQGYSHGVLSQNTYFRRVVFSDVCTANTSAVLSVTTLAACVAPLGNNTILGDQTISINTAPALFTGSVPSGGQNSLVYQWEQSLNQSTWSAITGATNQNYQAGNLLQQTWFRRIVNDLPCVPSSSSPISIEVICDIPIGNNQIGTDQTLVVGNSASTLTGTIPTGGSGIYTYQWESSANNSTWINISGATASSFNPGSPNQTSWFRRVVSGALCASLNSNEVMIVVVCGNPIGNNVLSASQTIFAGDVPAGLTGTIPTGGPGGFSYQWLQSLNQTTWTSISGATGQNYQPGALTQAIWYRRLAIAISPCAPDSSNILAISVLPDNSVVLARYATTQNQLSPSYVLPGGLLTAGNMSLGGSFTLNTGGPCAQGISLTNSTTSNGTLAFTLAPISGYQIRMSEFVCGGRRSTNGGANAVVSYSISGGGGSANSSALSVPSVTCVTNQNNAFNWNFNNTIVPNGRTVTFTKTFSSFAANGGATQVFSCEVYGTVECESVIGGNTITSSQTINYNDTPALLSGSVPSGGPGNISYTWQQSADNSTWSSITGGTVKDYQPSALTQNTYFRRIASFSVCAIDTTSSLSVLVIQNVCVSPLGNNTISANQTILSGTTPALFSGSVPSGGTGVFDFVWEESPDNLNWSSISGGTTSNLQYGILSQNSYFRRIVNASPCTPSTSNVISIQAEPCNVGITGNTVLNHQTISVGSSPALLSGNSPSGSPGYYQFAWQSSADNSTWSLISGATSQDFQEGSLYVNTWYRRIVIAFPCSNDTSSAVSISVICGAPIGNNTITGNQTIASGDLTALLTGSLPSGGSGIYSYQWESSLNQSNWNVIPGATALNYPSVNLSQSVWFRRVAASTPCSASTSNEVYVNVVPDSSVVLVRYAVSSGQLSSAYTQSGGSYSVSNLSVGGIFALSGSPCGTGLTLTNGTSTVGTGTISFTVTPSSGYVVHLSQILSGIRRSSQGAQNCQISYNISGGGATGASSILPTASTSCQTISNAQGNWNFSNFTVPVGRSITFTLTFSTFGGTNASTQLHTLELWGNVVCEAAIGSTSISGTQTILSSTTPALISGNSPVGGPGAIQYQWEQSLNQLSWSTISGSTSVHLQPSALTQSTYYRRLSSYSACAANTSNEVLITVFTAPGNNSIGSSQTICASASPAALTGSQPTGGDGNYSYQWEFSTDQSSWSLIPDATNQQFAPSTPSVLTWYRRQVTAYFSSYSNLVSVLPISLITQNTVSGAQTLCGGLTSNSLTGSLPAGGDGAYGYLWQSSSDNSGWTSISTATSQNHNPGMPSASVYFRRIVNSGYCPSITSSSVYILRYDLIGNNNISSNQTLCASGIPQTLTGSVPSGGSGVYSFLWQTSLNNSTWGNHPGTNQNLAPAYLAATTYYRRVVNSDICTADTSSIITVSLLVGQNDIASSQTIPFNSTPSTLLGLTNLNMPGYAWEQSPNNFHWTAISGANNASFSPVALTQHMWYRRKAAGQGCDTLISQPVKITLTMVTDTALIASSNSPVCQGAPLYLNAQGPSNASYLWSGPNGFTSALQNPSFTITTESLSGIYRVRCTNLNGDTASVTVNVEVGSSLGNFQVAYNNPICVGSTLILSSSYLPRVNYVWTGPNGFTSDRALNSFGNAQTTLNGVYSLVATSPGCQQISRSVSVMVNVPHNPMPGSNGPVCQSGVLFLTASTRPGATYLWFGPNGFSSNIPNPSISNVQTIRSGTYSLTVGGLGCSSVTQMHSVVVNSSIGNLSIAANTPICFGGTLQLSIPTYVNATYSWFGPNGFSSSGSNVVTRTNAQSSFSGVYSLQAIIPGCGSATINRSILVYPALTAAVGSNGPVCAGNSINLSSSFVSGATYAWTGPGGFVSTLQNPTISNAQISRSGSYSLTLTIPGCGSVSYTTAVQVNASPNTSTIAGNATVCEGNAMQLTATPITNASYTWTGPSTFTASGNSITRNPAQLAHAGVYSVSIGVPGCTSVARTFRVSVLANSSVIASASLNVCVGSVLALNASTITSATYSWSGPNGFFSTIQNPSLTNVQTIQSGIYTVIATQGTCGSSSSTVSVLVSPLPGTVTVSAAQSICVPGALTLTGTTIVGATLSWAGPGGFTASGSSFTKASTNLSDGGVYTYSVVTPQCGSASRTVKVFTMSGALVNGTVYPNPICTGQALYLQADFINGATYNWSGPGGFIVNTQNTSRPQITSLMSGIYTLTANVPGCGLVSQTFPVVVNPCREGISEEVESLLTEASLISLKIEVLPNPTDGLTTVTLHGTHSEEASLKVYDLMGHMVLVPGTVDQSANFKSWTLDFHGLAKGIYLLRIISREGARVERIVVR
jgi:hypothetical protein